MVEQTSQRASEITAGLGRYGPQVIGQGDEVVSEFSCDYEGLDRSSRNGVSRQKGPPAGSLINVLFGTARFLVPGHPKNRRFSGIAPKLGRDGPKIPKLKCVLGVRRTSI